MTVPPSTDQARELGPAAHTQYTHTIHTHTHTHTHRYLIHTYTPMLTPHRYLTNIYTHTLIYTHPCVYFHTHMHILIYTNTLICIHTNTNTHTNTHIQMYSHIHRHILTCTHAAPAWVSVHILPTRPMQSTLPAENGARTPLTPQVWAWAEQGPLPPGSPSPALLCRQLCCWAALGAALGSTQTRKPLCSVQRTTPQAGDSGHHHQPHPFLSKSLPKTNTPSAWRF